MLHGTTVATNALLEHDGAATGMLTTEGFRDIIHIGRHQRPHNFSLMQDIPFQRWPLVERKHRKTVPERVVPPGEIADAARRGAAASRRSSSCAAAGVESICVCFLFSFLRPEPRAARRRARSPSTIPTPRSRSRTRSIAQFREFERFTTTAVERLPQAQGAPVPRAARSAAGATPGVRCPIHVMQSNGGVAAIDEAASRAVNVLLSGPAAGVMAGKHIGNVNGHDHLITLDIGGTSADISVIPGRLLELDARDSKIGGYPILSPKLDVTAIGAGGGSIAWRDAGGAFNVGPRSAGADAGARLLRPRRHASRPSPTPTSCSAASTPTDFLAGRLTLDPQAARAARSRRIGLEFGHGRRGGGAGDPRRSSTRTWCARSASTRSGAATTRASARWSPSAAPARCTRARSPSSSRSPTILLPPAPGITSAMGLLTTDLKYDNVRTVGLMLGDADRDALEETFAAMEARAARAPGRP